MTARQLRVLSLRQQGWTWDKIAQALEISREGARQLAHRATRKHLRNVAIGRPDDERYGARQ